MLSLHHTTSSPAAEHEELINGMERLYQILIDLDYVQNTDVQVPPHGLPKDPIAVAQLRAAGVEPETIELIGRLPWFTNDIIELQRKSSNSRDGIAIAPFSSAASYLVGSGRHDEAREVGFGPVGGEELLPACAFKIATTSSSEGYNLAYDLNDKTIIRWHTNDWGKCQRIPVAEFFDEWLQHLRTLDWLPWRDETGWEVEHQQADRHKELEDPNSVLFQEIRDVLERERAEAEAAGKHKEPIENLFIHYVQVQKSAHSRYWAKRLIYERAGWPDNFDKEQFRQAQCEWNAKATELGASAASKSEAAQSNCKEHEGLREFYKSTAGKHAV